MTNKKKEVPRVFDESSSYAKTLGDHFEHFILHNPAVLFIYKPSGDFGTIFMSENVRALFGYGPEEFIEDSSFWAKHIHPEETERVFEEIKRLFETGSHILEYRFRLKDGSYLWVRDETRLVYDDQGEPLEIVGYWINIDDRKKLEVELEEKNRSLEQVVKKRTRELVLANKKLHEENIEHRQTEEQLRKSEERLLTAHRNARIGSWEFDLVTREAWWFDQSFLMLGLDLPALSRKPETLMNMVDPAEASVLKDHFYTSIKDRKPFNRDIRLAKSGGEIIWLNAKGDTVYDEKGNALKISGTVQDITDKKLVEQTIREAEQRYRIATDNGNTVIWTIDLSTAEVKSFGKIDEFVGYEKGQISREIGWINICHPDDRDRLNALRWEYFLGKSESFDIEHRVLHKDGSIIWVSSNGRVIKDENKQTYLLIGTSRDITRLKMAENDLKESEEKFRLLLTQMEQGLSFHEVIYDKAGKVADYRFLEMNESFRRQAGLKREQIIGKTVLEIFPNTEAYWIEKFGEVAVTGKPLHYENYSQEIDKYFEVNAYRPREHHFAVIITDITKKKLAEDALRESEERYRHISSTISDILYACRADGNGNYRISWLAGAVEHIMGYTAEELMALGCWKSLVIEEDIHLFNKHIIGLSTGSDSKCEIRIRHKQGDILWIQAFTECVKNNGNNLLYGALVDITERKQVEEALQKSESKYHTFFEYSAIPLVEEDFSEAKKYVDQLKASGISDWGRYFDEHPEEVARLASMAKIINYNTEAMKFVGASSEEEVPARLQDFFNEETWPVFREQMISFARGDLSYSGEISIKDISGRNKHVLVRLTVAPDSVETISRVLVSFIDITERKQLEDAYTESEKRYRQLIEKQGEGIGIVDKDENFVFLNPAGERIFGVQPGKLVNRNLKEFLHSDDIPLVLEETGARGKGLHSTYELRIIRTDGEPRILLITATPQLDKFGKYSGTFGVFRDITERKEAEVTIKEGEERYKSLVQGSPDIVYTFTLRRGGIFYSSRVEQIMGHTVEYMLANPFLWQDSVHPDDKAILESAISSFLEGKNFDLEYRIKNREGKWLWFRDRSIRLRHYNDEIIVDGLASDITEQKLAAENIQQIAERYQLATAASNDAIYDINLVNNEVAFNKAYKIKYGTPPETMDPWKWWDEQIHPEDRELADGGLMGAINGSGNTWTAEFRLLGMDGNWYIVHDRAFITRDEKGRAIRVVGAMTDITERKKAEEDLKMMAQQLRELSMHNEAIREEERANIAMNLHDDLGQKLTALNMELSVLKKELAQKAPTLQKRVESMILSTKGTISGLKKLSTQLRPSILDDLGLAEACRWQAKEFSEYYKIKCITYIDPPEIDASKDLSIKIFRIVQEALTNIARHASASESKISLVRGKQSLTLTVKDDGIGIAKDKINDPHSFGLFSMRERAKSCGGGLMIRGEKGKGTEIVVEIPVEEDM